MWSVIVLPVVPSFNIPFLQLDDNGTNCINKPEQLLMLFIPVSDFNNVTNITLVKLIQFCKHVKQQTSFYYPIYTNDRCPTYPVKR